MKRLLNKVSYSYRKLLDSNSLSGKIFQNIWKLLVLRGGGIIISFLLVPLTINYITSSQYGFWLTISSVVSWLSLFDIGLGHGLRNNLTSALVEDDLDKAREYISTTYGIIILISIGLILFVTPFIYIFDWQKVLGVTDIDNNTIKVCLLLVSVGFCIQFILNVINSILLAMHKSALSSFIVFLGQFLVLISIVLLKYFVFPNIIILVFVLTFVPIIITFVYSFYFFYVQKRSLSPRFKFFNKSLFPDLFSLGLGFFIVQIGSLVLFQTDNFIISNLFGSEAVTEFNVGYKLFSVLTMINFIILTPYWSGFTEAWTTKNYVWMKKSLSFLRKLWVLFVMGAVVLFFVGDKLIEFWVGNSVFVSKSLMLALMFYAITITFQATHNYIINGIGKIKLQVVLMSISAILNIPVSFLLGKMFGISGVVYSNVLFILILGVSFYFQCNSLILKKKIE